MPDDSTPEQSPEIASGPRPLSRNATRLFVIAAILFIIAATIGGTYYLVNMTDRALNAPMDTTGTEQADTTQMVPPDTTSPRPE